MGLCPDSFDDMRVHDSSLRGAWDTDGEMAGLGFTKQAVQSGRSVGVCAVCLIVSPLGQNG